MDCMAGTQYYWSAAINSGVFWPPIETRQGVCKGEVLGFRVHNADPLGRVITMRPATVSTAVAPHHKDTCLQRHGCAFVLFHTLSVSHSRGLERHHRVPIKPLGVQDSPDSLIHEFVHTRMYKYASKETLHVYCKYTNALQWKKAKCCSLSVTVSLLEREWQNKLKFHFTHTCCHINHLITLTIQTESLMECSE